MAARIDDVAGRTERLNAQLQSVLAPSVDGITLSAALVAFEARLEMLRLEFGGVAARAVFDPAADADVTAVNDALRAAESAALKLPRLMARLRAGSVALLAQLDRELPLLRASVRQMQDEVRSATATWGRGGGFGETEVALELLLANVVSLEEAPAQIALLTGSVEHGTNALNSVRIEIGRFGEAGRMRERCVSVGRFQNKSVKVTITATPVAATPIGAALVETVGRTAAGETATATSAVTRELTFEARAATHMHVKFGPIVSKLDNPEFRLEPIAAGCAADRECFMPYIVEPHARQVRAAVHLALYIPGRYWPDADPGDPYEARASPLRPYVTFGFPATDSAENLLLGGGIDLGRGVSLLGGWHFGRVRRLAREFRAVADDGLMGRAFDVSKGAEVSVADVVDTDWEADLYFSVSIDAATLGRVFGLATGGT